MINWLKKHFIPHEGNNHRPHLLRGENARWLVVIVLAVECVIFLLPTISVLNLSSQMGAVILAVLDQGTNQNRAAQKLSTLTVNPLLNESAQLKAEDMAANGYFAHVSPTGKTPWYWLKKVGYRYSYAGENLAINFVDSVDVTNAWMNSPTHRANILDGNYTEMGTGIATGTYDGRETIFIAQEFASPATADSPAPIESPSSNLASASIEKTTKNILSKTSKTAPASVKIPSTDTSSIASSPVSSTTAATGSASFLAFASTSDENNVGTTAPEVLGVTTTAPPTVAASTISPNWYQKLMASPHHAVNSVLFIILAIVLTALSIILFKINVRHPDLITNGLLVIVLIFAIYMFNGFWSHKGASIASNAQDSSVTQVQ